MILAAKGQYQDSLILHIMYSLTLDPYHLFGLRYEELLNNDKIQWWDYKSSSFKSEFLYNELWSDINFLKKMRDQIDTFPRCTIRTMPDLKK